MRIVIDTNIAFSAILNTNSLIAKILLYDVEFVALTDHIHGRLWSGDKVLQHGLIKKGWNKFISTAELNERINRK
jgi:predicted nucleic acid-binding protein